MINELEKNELSETEMASVAGGYGPTVPDGVLINAEDRRVWSTFTWAEKQEVANQPDRASMRAKLIEIYKRTHAVAHGGGASGGWR